MFSGGVQLDVDQANPIRLRLGEAHIRDSPLQGGTQTPPNGCSCNPWNPWPIKPEAPLHEQPGRTDRGERAWAVAATFATEMLGDSTRSRAPAGRSPRDKWGST